MPKLMTYDTVLKFLDSYYEGEVATSDIALTVAKVLSMWEACDGYKEKVEKNIMILEF